MFFATQLQSLEYVRALLTAQDDAGSVPAPTADETSSPDTKCRWRRKGVPVWRSRGSHVWGYALACGGAQKEGRS